MTLFKRLLPAVSLLLLCAYFTIRVPMKTGTQSFLTFDNLFGLSGQYAYLMLIAVGATLVIIAGGIDLSVGSVLALAGVVASTLMVNKHWNPWLASLAGVVAGALAGTVNGLIVTRLKVPPFIATLGMLLAARGLALRIAGGVTVDGVPDSFNVLASARPLGIPMPLILIVLVAALAAFVLHYTKFGRYVYAIGSNREAARVSGVPIDRVTVATYAIGGALAGLAGLVETARQASGNPTGGESYELDVVTAVVVGGASLAGGEGRISGTILGALLIAILRNGANLLGVEPFDQKMQIGLLIVAAVAFDQLLRKKSSH